MKLHTRPLAVAERGARSISITTWLPAGTRVLLAQIGMPESSTSSGTVARVAKLLQVLAEAESPSPLGLIAARMELPSSTTHRLLNLLAEQGFVERDVKAKTYRVGLEFFRVGSLVAASTDLPDIATTFMQQVVDDVDETCMLSLREASTHSFMIAKVIYGSHPLRYEVKLYRRSSLLWGAPGRGILAFLPEKDIEAAIAHERAHPSHNPARPLAALKKDLVATRERGYAFTKGQNVTGAVGVSAPIFDVRGVIGALCVTTPEGRFNDQKFQQVARAVTHYAKRLSQTLGVD